MGGGGLGLERKVLDYSPCYRNAVATGSANGFVCSPKGKK